MQDLFENRKLKHGDLNDVVTLFGVSRHSISNFWKRVSESVPDRSPLMNVVLKKSSSGQKRKNIYIATVDKIPLNQKGTVTSTASALSVPKSTLFRCIKRRTIRLYSSYVKPFLTETNVAGRIRFCRSHISTGRSIFHSMRDFTHVDQRRIYMASTASKYYHGREQKEPYQTTKRKQFSSKVIFLTAMAKPGWNTCKKKIPMV